MQTRYKDRQQKGGGGHRRGKDGEEEEEETKSGRKNLRRQRQCGRKKKDQRFKLRRDERKVLMMREKLRTTLFLSEGGWSKIRSDGEKSQCSSHPPSFNFSLFHFAIQPRQASSLSLPLPSCPATSEV